MPSAGRGKSTNKTSPQNAKVADSGCGDVGPADRAQEADDRQGHRSAPHPTRSHDFLAVCVFP